MTEQIKNRIAEINQGKVPAGYKKTPLGIIPEEWEDKTLNDIGDFYKGKGIPGNALQNDGVPCIGYGDIYMKYNFHFEKALNFVSQKTADESQPIQKGTLLFTGSGETAEEIGKCVCYNGDETIYAGGDIILYNADINPLFVSYQQSIGPSIKAKAKFAQGHSVVHIYADRLGKLSVAYPRNQQEQQKVADILMKWDEAIALQKKLLEKLEVQKKALLQRLLKPQDDWEEIFLEKILFERKEYSGKGLDFTHVTLSKEGVCDKTDQYNRDFLVASEDKAYKVTRYNDLCYNPANLKFGVICLNKYGEAIFSPIYVTYEINSKYNPDFIGAIVTSANFIEKIRRFEEGTLYERQAVKPSDFIRDTIFVPDKMEQDRIAQIISSFNDNLALQKNKLDKLELQQKSLMQFLLTGIVRV